MTLKYYKTILPELELYGDDAAQRAALANARASVGTLQRLILIVLGGGSLLGFMPAITSGLLARIGIHNFPGYLWGGIIGAAVATSIPVWIDRPVQRFLRRDLNEMGIPVCMRCGYCLRGVGARHCPECAKPFSDPTRPDSHE